MRWVLIEIAVVMAFVTSTHVFAASRIPITPASQRLCHMANVVQTGKWDNGQRGYVYKAQSRGFTELECAHHLADGSRWSNPERRQATYARLLRKQDPATTARAAQERAKRLEAVARRARAGKNAAAEAAARQARIEAERLATLRTERREADATARLEAARKMAAKEQEAKRAQEAATLAKLDAERKLAEAKARQEALAAESAKQQRLRVLLVGLRSTNELMEVAVPSAKVRKLPTRRGGAVRTLTNGHTSACCGGPGCF